jgi:hypothetical protein
MRLLFLVLSIFYMNSAYPQVNFEWAKLYDGNGERDHGNKVKIDKSNNIYITGISEYLGRVDMIFLKYSPNGNIIWNSVFADTSSTQNPNGGTNILFDKNDNIFVSRTQLWKYDNSGNLIWNVFPGRKKELQVCI